MKVFLALASEPDDGCVPEFGGMWTVVAPDKTRALDLLLERFPWSTREWWYDIQEVDTSVEGVVEEKEL